MIAERLTFPGSKWLFRPHLIIHLCCSSLGSPKTALISPAGAQRVRWGRHVPADGEAPMASLLEGRQIVSRSGLSPWHAQVYPRKVGHGYTGKHGNLQVDDHYL